MKVRQLAFVDTETTGLVAGRDQILEVAVAVLDLDSWDVVDRYQSLVHYTGPIPDFHRGRFTAEDLANAPDLRLVIRDLAGFLKGRAIAGQNICFDLGFLRHAFALCEQGWTADYHVVDTATIGHFLDLLGLVPGVSLKHLRAWAGREGVQAHRAMADVDDTMAVYLKFVDLLGSV